MNTFKRTLFITALFCSGISAFAATPQQVKASSQEMVCSHKRELKQELAALEEAKRKIGGLPMVAVIRLAYLQEKLESPCEQCTAQSPPMPTDNVAIGEQPRQNISQPTRRGLKVRRPDNKPESPKPLGPTTVADQVTNVYKEYIRNYEIVLNALRSIHDTQSANAYMPWIPSFTPVDSRQMTPNQQFEKALQELSNLQKIENNLINRHTAAVVTEAAQPYIGKIQEHISAITAELNRIVDHQFFQSSGCEHVLRQKFGYNGPITTDPTGTYSGNKSIGELFDELIRS